MATPNTAKQTDASNFYFFTRVTYENAQKGVTLLLGVVAIAYGLGVLLSNQYLMSLGSSDFNSVRPKYVITGTWTMICLLLMVLPGLPLAILVYAEAITDGREFLKAAASTLTISILYVFAFRSLPLNQHITPVPFWQLVVIGSFGLILCAALFLLLEKFHQRELMRVWIIYAGLACISPVFLFLSMHQIARGIYDKVPEALGGGKPISAELVLNKDGLEFWKQTGALLPPSEGSMCSGRIQILYENDHQLLIKAPYQLNQASSEKIIILDKRLVDGIIP